MSKQIPLVDLRPIHQACRKAFTRRLAELFERSQWILGPEVEAFEQEFARFTGADRCAGTGNGTDALQLALRIAGVSADQEVLTTPLTAPFTGLAVLAAGARPVFADVDEVTLLLDPASAAQRIGPGTAALLPVHLYGQTCDLDAWRALARRSGAELVQDAAQAHGARHRNRPLTDYSRLVAYSFYPTKNLGALGDGGALCLTREEDWRLARQLRDGGRQDGHTSTLAGINSRLDEIQAAFLRIGLTHLTAWNQARAQVAAVYDEELAALPPELLRPVARASQAGHVFHLYVVRTPRRDALREHLSQCGIQTGVHYPVPLHLQPAFRSSGFAPGDLPVAERASREILSLPMGPYLSEAEAQEVARSIRVFFGL
jgi:dTDP-3-amino-3,4,6-trideoxy-alpha-D-glucose transaminase